MAQLVTVHRFDYELGYELHDVFIVYHADLFGGRMMFGLWSEHPRLAAVLDMLGGDKRGTWTAFTSITQEEFADLIDGKEKLGKNLLDLKQ